MQIELLLGRIVDKIDNINNEELVFYCSNGRKFKMYHSQDCCEVVNIEEIIGDLDDLIGSPILEADERTQQDTDASDSATWTFYELRTNKGSVTVRWYGSSNGYYSEEADFCEIT